MSCLDLDGKLILVTGASSGIGRAVAIHVSELGGKPILLGRSRAELELTAELLAGSSSVCVADLANNGQISHLATALVEEDGPIDGLVHCAGVQARMALPGVTRDFFDAAMSINLYAFVELLRAFSKNGSFNPGASMVAISSVASQLGRPGGTVYGASKSALESAVRSLAHELSPKGIRVNCVSPGIVRTPFTENLLSKIGASEQLQAYVSRQYLGILEPKDVASVVCFLLTNQSKFVTGAAIPVDGGLLTS